MMAVQDGRVHRVKPAVQPTVADCARVPRDERKPSHSCPSIGGPLLLGACVARCLHEHCTAVHTLHTRRCPSAGAADKVRGRA